MSAYLCRSEAIFRYNEGEPTAAFLAVCGWGSDHFRCLETKGA